MVVFLEGRCSQFSLQRCGLMKGSDCVLDWVTRKQSELSWDFSVRDESVVNTVIMQDFLVG